jgi:hypothetical protein
VGPTFFTLSRILLCLNSPNCETRSRTPILRCCPSILSPPPPPSPPPPRPLLLTCSPPYQRTTLPPLPLVCSSSRRARASPGRVPLRHAAIVPRCGDPRVVILVPHLVVPRRRCGVQEPRARRPQSCPRGARTKLGRGRPPRRPRGQRVQPLARGRRRSTGTRARRWCATRWCSGNASSSHRYLL